MMRITAMRCGHERRPLGIPTDEVRFSWQMEADNGYQQQAYRLQVLDEAGETVWDSGKRRSSEQLYIPCRARLKPFTFYRWMLTVWGQGKSVAHRESTLMTGISLRSDWAAPWLSPPGPEGARVRLAKKDFHVGSQLKRAILFIASGGEKMNALRVYINGRPGIGCACFPGPSEKHVGRYRGYDVTALITPGVNVLTIDHVCRFSAYLVMDSAEGVRSVITTDATWRVLDDGPFIQLGHDAMEKHHGKLEVYDARRLPPNWRTTPCRDEAPAEPAPPPAVLSYLWRDVVVYDKREPVAIAPTGDGRLRIDFGVNGAGYPVCRFHEPEGTVVELEMAEALDERGLPAPTYGRNTAYRPQLRYICRGTDDHDEPSFFHTSMRYLFVKGIREIRRGDFSLHLLSTELDGADTFSCSLPALTCLETAIRRTFRANLLHIPTDCPGRERRGWTADSYAVIQAQAQRFDVIGLYRRWFEDMAANQRMDGWLHVEFPMSTALSVDLNWSVSAVLDPALLYEQTGDLLMLRQAAECSRRYMALLLELMDQDGALPETAFSYGDWMSDEGMSKRFIGMAYCCRAAETMAHVHALLGDREAADRAARLHTRLRSAIQARCDHGDHYDSGSQSADIHTLAFRLCPEEQRPAIFGHLTASLARQERLTCGFMSTALLFPLLGEWGRNDLALRLMLDDRAESRSLWSWMLTSDATAIPEHPWMPDASRNHPFQAGGMARWINECLLGVSPLLPGYRASRIRPWFGAPMAQVQGSIHTPYGLIKVAWVASDDNITCQIILPANTWAEVVLPSGTRRLDGGQHQLSWQREATDHD